MLPTLLTTTTHSSFYHSAFLDLIFVVLFLTLLSHSSLHFIETHDFALVMGRSVMTF